MLVNFTDAVTQKTVSINPVYVTAVFTAAEGEHEGKTVIGLTNGSLLVEQSQNETIGIINGALN